MVNHAPFFTEFYADVIILLYFRLIYGKIV